jgi:hypothetical protein
MRFLPALALGFSMLSATAHAETAACPAKATILAFSDAVLADREKLPRLKARGFGAEAAYLKIRYDDLSLEEAADLAHGLRDAGVREAIDLAGAIDATRGGFSALGITDPVQLNGLISTQRAILLHGDGDKLLAAIAALPPERQTPLSGSIVPAIIDWADEDKARLAASAGRLKLYFLQAGLVASQRDPKAWSAFVKDFPEQAMLDDLTRTWSWVPALEGKPALPRLPAAEAKIQAMRKSLHTMSIVAAKEPERDFLMTYVNQTGDIATAEKAAKAVLAEITAGRTRPEGLLDPAWLTAYRALRAVAPDPAVADTTLESISFYTRRVIGPTGNASIRDAIDQLLAVDALTPYLTGKAADLPDMPADISAKFQREWPLWVELATSLKTVPLTPFAKDAAKAPIVAALLFAANDHARLADFVLSVEPADMKLAIATDFAMRLDRTCASFLYHPGEAMMLSGQPIFRFDPAK